MPIASSQIARLHTINLTPPPFIVYRASCIVQVYECVVVNRRRRLGTGTSKQQREDFSGDFGQQCVVWPSPQLRPGLSTIANTAPNQRQTEAQAQAQAHRGQPRAEVPCFQQRQPAGRSTRRLDRRELRVVYRQQRGRPRTLHVHAKRARLDCTSFPLAAPCHRPAPRREGPSNRGC